MSYQAINHINWDGKTALILAIEKGLEEVCKLLIPKMSRPAINCIICTESEYNNETALTLAIKKGLDKVCELLIEKMSDEAINNTYKNTCVEYDYRYFGMALCLAVKKDSEQICKLLMPKLFYEVINHVTYGEKNNINFCYTRTLRKSF